MNLERVADLVAASRADVVLLQEIDRGTRRSEGVDHLARLRELTGFNAAFGKSLDYQGGDYGIAILSRWPILAHETVPLRTDPPQPRAGGELEPRVALLATIRAPGGPLTVVNTHFDASRVETWRLQEAEGLLERLAAVDGPLLAGGDFNAEPDSAVWERLRDGGLRDAWLLCGEGEGLTFPAKGPVKRIDYLFLRGSDGCDDATVLESGASDHRPLFVVK